MGGNIRKCLTIGQRCIVLVYGYFIQPLNWYKSIDLKKLFEVINCDNISNGVLYLVNFMKLYFKRIK